MAVPASEPAAPELDFASRRPHPALRSMVSRYVGYRQEGVTLPVHRGLPSGYLTLVVSLARPVRLLELPGSAQSPGQWYGFVGGLHIGPALIEQDPVQAGVQLELNPLGVRTLLGLPSAELSGRVLDLADLPTPSLATLPERLRAAPDWSTRFDLLDRALLTAAFSASTGPAQRREPPDEVHWAWRRLLGTGGAVAVRDLADEVGWSRRHFSARFTQEVGLTPKQAARVVRFGRATALLRAQPPSGGLAELAARCGYFDQAHLTNEWRALAGCTPRTWIAEELPFLNP